MAGSKPCYYLLPVLGCGIGLLYICCLATIYVGVNIIGEGGNNRTSTFTMPEEILIDPIIEKEDLTPKPGLLRNSCQIRVPWWHVVLGILCMVKVLDLVLPCKVRMTMLVHHRAIVFVSVVMVAVVTSVGMVPGLYATQHF